MIENARLFKLPPVIQLVENVMRCPQHAELDWESSCCKHFVQGASAMPGHGGVKNEFTAKLGADGSGHACYLSAMPRTRIVRF